MIDLLRHVKAEAPKITFELQPIGQPGHPPQGRGIGVDQPQLAPTELRHAEHVAQQLDPEDDAADPDRDELHGRPRITHIGQG